MQISGPGAPSPLQLRLPAQALNGVVLKHGETVNAVVRSSDTAGQLTLEISGKLLQAVTSLRLAAGTVLSLRVEKHSEQLILHLADKDQQQLAYQQALRQTLPRQQSLQPLLERLQQFQPPEASTNTAQAKQPGIRPRAEGHTQAAPTHAPPREPAASAGTAQQPVSQAIARLLAVLPAPENLGNIEGLKQAIAASGLFMENTLLQGGTTAALDSDVKTVLLRLARAIRDALQAQQRTPAQTTRGATESNRESLEGLLRQVESGLARIQLNQLNALNSRSQADERLLLNLELPVFTPQQKEFDLLQLKIHRDRGRHGGQEGPLWSVTLHINPAGFGSIHAVVSLASGRVSTTFWCEQEQTGKLFRQQLEVLQERFVEQGLEVGRCTAITGSPPDEVTATDSTAMHGLIDTRA